MAETKDVQVNKFRVKYNGEHYGPGQSLGNIIHGMPSDIADKLIAGSNGTVIEIPRAADVKKNPSAIKGKSAANAEAALPAIDPGETVK